MKRYSVFLFICLSLTFCRSFDESIFDTQTEIHKKYSGYSLFINQDSIRQNFTDEYYDESYRADVKRLMENRLKIPSKSNSSKPVGGHISVIVRETETSEGWLWKYVSALVAPLFLGLPYDSFHGSIVLDVAVFDPKGKLLKRFKVTGERNLASGLYYGYFGSPKEKPGYSALARTVMFRALERALVDVKVLLASDGRL